MGGAGRLQTTGARIRTDILRQRSPGSHLENNRMSIRIFQIPPTVEVLSARRYHRSLGRKAKCPTAWLRGCVLPAAQTSTTTITTTTLTGRIVDMWPARLTTSRCLRSRRTWLTCERLSTGARRTLLPASVSRFGRLPRRPTAMPCTTRGKGHCLLSSASPSTGRPGLPEEARIIISRQRRRTRQHRRSARSTAAVQAGTKTSR